MIKNYLDWFDTASDAELAQTDAVVNILIEFGAELLNGGSDTKRMGDWALELIETVEQNTPLDNSNATG